MRNKQNYHPKGIINIMYAKNKQLKNHKIKIKIDQELQYIESTFNIRPWAINNISS